MGVDLKKVKKHTRKVEKERGTKRRYKTKYKVFKRGDKVSDVQLFFGAYSNMRITEMLHDPGAINYIKTFLLNPDTDFPSRFVRLVREVFEENYSNFLDDDIPF